MFSSMEEVAVTHIDETQIVDHQNGTSQAFTTSQSSPGLTAKKSDQHDIPYITKGKGWERKPAKKCSALD